MPFYFCVDPDLIPADFLKIHYLTSSANLPQRWIVMNTGIYFGIFIAVSSIPSATQLMKLKTLLLQDHSAYTELIDGIIKAPEYDVFRFPPSSFDELSMFIFTLQPDLIICEETYRQLILNTEKKIKKTIPIVFIGTSKNLSDQPQMNNRSTAYLTYPFKEEVLKAMINLLI